jgi:hypothetical protein
MANTMYLYAAWCPLLMRKGQISAAVYGQSVVACTMQTTTNHHHKQYTVIVVAYYIYIYIYYIHKHLPNPSQASLIVKQSTSSSGISAYSNSCL